MFEQAARTLLGKFMQSAANQVDNPEQLYTMCAEPLRFHQTTAFDTTATHTAISAYSDDQGFSFQVGHKFRFVIIVKEKEREKKTATRGGGHPT